jgi:hypothetical protein
MNAPRDRRANIFDLFICFSLCFLFSVIWLNKVFNNLAKIFLPRHRDADDIAPLADALVGLEVDGLVFPERALTGGWPRN